MLNICYRPGWVREGGQNCSHCNHVGAQEYGQPSTTRSEEKKQHEVCIDLYFTSQTGSAGSLVCKTVPYCHARLDKI